MLKINNVELELDLMDADVADKFEKAMRNMDKKEKEKSTEGKSVGDIIRQECTIVFDFFNEVWGEGTDKKVFGGKTNYSKCEEAFKQVVDYSNEQVKELEKRTKKYSPDRATRS